MFEGLFYSIFRTTPEVSSKLYYVEICQVSEKLWLFNHKRADFWLPNFGFKRYILLLLDTIVQTCYMLRIYMMFYMSVPPPFVFCSPKGTIMKIRSISDLYYAIPATVS